MHILKIKLHALWPSKESFIEVCLFLADRHKNKFGRPTSELVSSQLVICKLRCLGTALASGGGGGGVKKRAQKLFGNLCTADEEQQIYALFCSLIIL